MKFTGENLAHMGFYVKATLSVSQCWGRGKRETKSAVPDVEKPNYSAAGFLFFFPQGLLDKQICAQLSK